MVMNKSNDFITNLKYWTAYNSYIHFVSCNFNLNNYHPEQFNSLKIVMPEEIKRSIAKRQAEFLAGRVVAMKALVRLGFLNSNVPIIAIGKNRDPIWPTGYVGSITHNKNTAICAIGTIEKTRFLGIDIETTLDDVTVSETASQIHDEVEKLVLVNKGLTSNEATTLIFSAKESIFKALYPFVQDYFGFESFRVKDINIHQKSITFTISKPFQYKTKLQENHTVHYQKNKDLFLTSFLIRGDI